MIGKVTRGKAVAGLVRYLFGPGRANEHDDPRVVAGWDEPAAIEPATTARGLRDFRPLITKLNAPLAAVKTPAKSVWHCSLRTAPGDRSLSDAEWREVAAEVMDRTGLDARGDDGGCRWMAVRHAEDHVHLVATLARQDGHPAVLARNDFFRVGEACKAVEQRYGLSVTAGRDRTAASRPTRAENEKAQRLAKPAVARDVLRLEVQLASAGASGEEEFFARLEAAGVMVGKRFSERDPEEVTGYRVALPGSMGGLHTSEGKPVWYGGGKLAADLSLPKLRAHWGADVAVPVWRGSEERMSSRLRLRHQVERAASGARSPAELFARLRSSGVLVRERCSELRPGEITGYAVAWPGEHDRAGQPVWRGGASLGTSLSLPQLQARWESEGGEPRTTPLSEEERAQVWSEAGQAVDAATRELRRLPSADQMAVLDIARSAADVLNVVARVGEPSGQGELHEAAHAYDRASREAYGRTGRATAVGVDLRLAATTLALMARAGRSDGAALVGLTVALAGLLDAVAQLRAVQGRSAQALAAQVAAEQLRSAVTSVDGTVSAIHSGQVVASSKPGRRREAPPPPGRRR